MQETYAFEESGGRVGVVTAAAHNCNGTFEMTINNVGPALLHELSIN